MRHVYIGHVTVLAITKFGTIEFLCSPRDTPCYSDRRRVLFQFNRVIAVAHKNRNHFVAAVKIRSRWCVIIGMIIGWEVRMCVSRAVRANIAIN